MNELALIAAVVFVLEALLLIINYMVFSKHPKKKELALGGGILKRWGVLWFVFIKFVLFTTVFVVLLAIIPLLPIRYSYFVLGVLLGVLCLNIFHDCLEYGAEDAKLKNDKHIFKLDEIPKGSRLERYLRELPEVMKERRAILLFTERMFSECLEFLARNYDAFELPQLTLSLLPTHEQFKLEEQRAFARASSKEIAKAEASAFQIGNEFRARICIDFELFLEALRKHGYPTFTLFLVETFLHEILHSMFLKKYEQEIWDLQCAHVESFMDIKLPKERRRLKASDYYSKA